MTNVAKPFDVAIAGGGPAGTSAAIQLAMSGARVVLIEEKKFPRAKLCGEFISPECFAHFERLGVAGRMIAAGGAALSETVFYSRKANSVAVPSEWLASGKNALGLSRTEMDHKLLQRARDVGVTVIEDAHACGLLQERGEVHGVRIKSGRFQIANDCPADYRALVTMDATGRARALARQVDVSSGNQKKITKPTLVAFKAHLENARVADGACEIYFYPGGYGGLSSVEGGFSNLCFIVSATAVRRHGSDAETVLREVVMKNARAKYTLAEATARTPWLSVSLDGFGRRTLSPAKGLLTVGDAAAFIDPFTGSGMLMALESGQVAADTITRHLAGLREGASLELLASDYQTEYLKRFSSRLRVSGLLRRAAFVPRLADAAIFLFGLSSRLRRKTARATRHSSNREVIAPTV
jgi:flavin-dependent dehydrogenase